MSESPLSASVDAGEIAKFAAQAAQWWDPAGKFRPLHRLNPVRLGFIRDEAVSHFGADPRALTPFAGLSVLDIGCGGGLVCEPMARLGAAVTGIDAAEESILTARAHAQGQGLAIDYRAGAAETLAEAGARFDMVLNLEVVEHVVSVPDFIAVCAALLEPGGLMVCATLNRTPKAFALAILGAEYALRWLEPGTHDWRKFVKPGELDAALRAAGLVPGAPRGIVYDPLADRFRPGADIAVNYMVSAVKPA